MKTTNRKVQQKTSYADSYVAKLIFDAHTYYEKNDMQQSNFLYQKALQLEPKNIQILNGIGLIAMQAGMLKLAAEFLNMAWELNPDDLETNRNLALVYNQGLRFNDAILHYICMLNIDENNAQAHTELAGLNLHQGNLDLALHHYMYAFELKSSDPCNIQGIAEIDASVLSEKDISSVEALLENTSLSLQDRCSFYFSLGKIHDESGRFDEAYANYLVANLTKGSVFNGDQHISSVSQIIKLFNAELFDEFDEPTLNNSAQPVFIVGMPCSGASLVENILCRKSDIYSVGEDKKIQSISEKIEKVHNVSNHLLTSHARFYLNEINNLAANSESKKPSKIINSMSGNYLHLGLIALLFPKAQIIHCVRDPFDVCLSSYCMNFSKGHGYAYKQEDISLYFQQYQRLMAHWNKVLPGKILHVSYEKLVQSPAAASKQLFEFINVDCKIEDFLAEESKMNPTRCSLTEISCYKASFEKRQYYQKHFPAFVNKLSIKTSVRSYNNTQAGR